jgi:repressor LexA
MAFNLRIREARKKRGMTQAQLGSAVGCAKNTISSYESGTNEPNMLILSKILRTLNVDANYIFQDELHDEYENNATFEEMDYLVRPFRLLDDTSKSLVLTVLKIETKRTQVPPLDATLHGGLQKE